MLIGVSLSGCPDESSTSISHRLQIDATRRAKNRLGVISATVLSGVFNVSRIKTPISSASSWAV